MMEMFCFRDVVAAVVRHVETTGHQDVRAYDVPYDQPRANMTGYACHTCSSVAGSAWMAPLTTVENIKGKYKNLKLKDGKVRARFAETLIKEGLGLRHMYRPTAWDRVLKA
jgi:hypothetical protein